MNKLLKSTLNILLGTILIYCTYKISTKLIDYKKSETLYKQVEEIKSKTPNENESYKKLKGLNRDYKLWMEIENTNINYPVVQSIDNSYYLQKDFFKNDSDSGTIFLDYRNNYKNDFNTIIYGHNMKNQKLFNNLEKFKDKNFFNENNQIHISDEKNKYTYEVFSISIVDGNSDASHHYSINKYKDKSSISNYTKNIMENSLLKKDITVSEKDKLLTLVTCSYETNDSRTIIHGKLVSHEEL